MAFNQVAKYYQGYVESTGNTGGIIAGLNKLLLMGSTDLAGVCADYSGNVYVTDAAKHIILKITEGGTISVLAGLSGSSGNNSDTTVTASAARFNYPTGIACDKNGDLYVCDTNNHQIRKISNDKVSLIAGSATPTSGTSDGVGHSAKFNTPYGIDIDYSGDLYIADTNNHSIRKIKGGVVTTLAGLTGTSGNSPVWNDMTTAEGILGYNARFNSPYAIAVNANGYVFVSDTDNHVIKRIDPAGRVRIFSGSGVAGTSIGTSPYYSKTCNYQSLRFSDVTKSEELYVVDFDEAGASRLMVINREGRPAAVINFTVGSDEGKYLASVVCNPAGHIIVVESNYTNIEFSSSSSSSYIENWSSSSNSSSSNSSSSNSSSSNSSSSSTEIRSSSSSSSVSSPSSDSSSTEVRSSSSSSSISSDSSSSLSSLSSSSLSSPSSDSSSTEVRSSSSSSSISSASSPSSDSSSSLSSESSSSLSSESSSYSSLSSSSRSSASSESSSSNSSSSVSSSSLSSASSNSSSSNSSSSNSSSSNSSSSNSSSSNSSSSLSSESSSSSSLLGCEPKYCASTFTTVNINGTYDWTGASYNSKPVYNNGNYNLWYSAGFTKWAISVVVGAGQGSWVSANIAAGGCPNGTYDSEAGVIAVGSC